MQFSTWPEVEDHLTRSKLVLVPVGSTEQHGPTGLLGTDSLCPEIVADKAAEEMPILIAPTLNVGQAQHHMGFAGSLSVRPSTLIATVVDWVASLHCHGFTHIYFFNGHGGNVGTLEAAMAECYAPYSLRGEPCPYRLKLRNWWELPGVIELCRRLYPIGHGNHATPSEIAVTLHAYPEHADKQARLATRLAPLGGAYTDAADFRRQFPDGRIGSDPTLADAKAGAEIIATAARALRAELTLFGVEG